MSPLSARQAEARRECIGASDVAALPPWRSHRFRSELSLYCRIVLGIAEPENEAMQIGKALEAPVLRLAERKLGLRLRANPNTYRHPTLPLVANPDAIALRDPDTLVEIKVGVAWYDGVPDDVQLQAQTSLWLSGRSICHVVALNGARLNVYTIEANPSLQGEIAAAVMRFDEHHLKPRNPPAATDEDPANLILSIAPLPAGTIVARGQLRIAGNRYAKAVRRVRAREKPAEALRAMFARVLAENGAETVLGPSWKATVQTAKDGSRRFRFLTDGDNGGSPMV